MNLNTIPGEKISLVLKLFSVLALIVITSVNCYARRIHPIKRSSQNIQSFEIVENSVFDNLKIDPHDYVCHLKIGLKNESKSSYSIAKAVVVFYDQKSQPLFQSSVEVDNIDPGKTKYADIPISFFGDSKASQYNITKIWGVKQGKVVISSDVALEHYHHYPMMLMDPTLSPAWTNTSYMLYDGPSYDTAFKTPGLRLLYAEFTPINDENPVAFISGKVENDTGHILSYVEIDGNLLTAFSGDQEDGSVANVINLANGAVWDFKIPFVGHEGEGWTIVSLSGR